MAGTWESMRKEIEKRNRARYATFDMLVDLALGDTIELSEALEAYRQMEKIIAGDAEA